MFCTASIRIKPWLIPVLYLFCLIQNSAVYAEPYTGSGVGTSTIGEGGDYPSLYQAAHAISSAGPGIHDWTFLILNDLVEPLNCSFTSHNQSFGKITIRPAPDTSSTITFTDSSSGQYAANIAIGTTTPLQLKPINDLTFDGSNNPSGSEQNLTIQNTGAASRVNLVQVIGNCDNIRLVNLQLVQRSDAGIAPYELGAIGFSTEQDGRWAPPRATVQNCNIITTSLLGAAIRYNVSQNFSSDLTLSFGHDLTISSNTIRSHSRGIEISRTATLEVSNNDITLYLGNGFTENTGVRYLDYHFGTQTQSLDTTGLILNNTIRYVRNVPSLNRDLMGIRVRTGFGKGWFLIQNNMITGLSRKPLDSYDRYCLAISCHSATTQSETLIYHNSIEMTSAHTNVPVNPDVCSIFCNGLVLPSKGNMKLRNNLVRLSIPDTPVIETNSPEALVDSDYNNFHLSNNSVVAFLNNTQHYPTLLDWQTSMSQDVHSSEHDPYQPQMPGMGTWIGPAESAYADLHFSSFPGSAFLAPAIPMDNNILNADIDGHVRSQPFAVKGADEMLHTETSVENWDLY